MKTTFFKNLNVNLHFNLKTSVGRDFNVMCQAHIISNDLILVYHLIRCPIPFARWKIFERLYLVR